MGQPLEGVVLATVLGLALRDRMARPGRARVPEPMVMDDPDVPMPGGFVHWVVYKIPAAAKGLPAELPMDATLTAPAELAGTIQGLSGFRRAGYRGPAPPAGKPHHYTFTVYALDTELTLAEGANRAELMKAMEGHIIGQGALVAIYERKPAQ